MKTNFLTKPNISMIWDVISDEDTYKFLSRDIQQNISQVFFNNLNGFYENELNKSSTLVEMNKKYIILISNFIKTNYTQKLPNKIKIHEEVIADKQVPITYEEIQNNRLNQFEKNLIKHQEDFTNAITLTIPDVPNFKDNQADEPIKEMEKMIQEMKAKRNYEDENINRGLKNQDDNWLKSQETSIKNEKLQPIIPKEEKMITNSKLKYIKIENDNISLNVLDKKRNVSWGVNEEISETPDIATNIFSKLKKIEVNNTEVSNEKNTDTIIRDFSNRLYEMQEEIIKMQDFLKNLIKN
jgi:hypothetical protein